MRKKLAVLVVLSLLASILFAGCAPSGTEQSSDASESVQASESASGGESAAVESGEKMVIGFVPMTLNNEYFITMVNGAQEEADALGVQLDVQAADQHASAADQLAVVENMITSGVDAICIVPSSSEGLGTALKKAAEANIPVVNIDTKLDQSVLDEVGVEVPFYGTDNYAGAKLAGEYVAANFDPGIKVAILTGIEGQQNTSDRRNGFVDGAGDAIEIVAEQSANWEVDQGYTAAQNIISGNPELGLIFASNDGMAIGALRAVQEVDKTEQIKVIGFDAISEALNLVKSGELLGTVAQYPAEMGKLGVESAVKMIKGESVEAYIDTGSKLILADNVQEFMDYASQYAD